MSKIQYSGNMDDPESFSQQDMENLIKSYNETIDAIGVITGDVEYHKEYDSYNRLRKVKWLVKGINENIVSHANDIYLTQKDKSNIVLEGLQEAQRELDKNVDIAKEKTSIPFMRV